MLINATMKDSMLPIQSGVTGHWNGIRSILLKFIIRFLELISDCPRTITSWKVSKYGVISGPYFPVFGLNPYLDTFHAVYAAPLGLEEYFEKQFLWSISGIPDSTIWFIVKFYTVFENMQFLHQETYSQMFSWNLYALFRVAVSEIIAHSAVSTNKVQVMSQKYNITCFITKILANKIVKIFENLVVFLKEMDWIMKLLVTEVYCRGKSC